MKLKLHNGTSVTVNSKDFIARGGGGEVYVLNDTVYKICHKGQMPSAQKLQELSVLDRPNIIRPLETFVATDGREGYTMAYVNDPVPITQVVTVTYRKKHKLQQDTMLSLVRKMQDGINFVHSKGILIVDLNELNFLTDDQHKNIYFIDVDSYQTPSFPALAIMDTIRDRQVTQRDASGHVQWTKLSDWYSFAIVSFQLFVGMHPFKGNHPKHGDPKTSMDGCMRDGLSILNPATKYPRMAVMPFSVIPDVYLEWYKAVFEEGKRIPPPTDLVAKIVIVTPQVKSVVGSNTFVTRELFSYPNDILEYLRSPTNDVVVTTAYETFVNNRLAKSPSVPYRVGFGPGDKPIAAFIDNGKVSLYDLQLGIPISFSANGEKVMSSGGRFYIKNHSQMLEIQFSSFGGQIIASPQRIMDVADRATQVFDGVVIQTLFDAHSVSVFPEARQCRQFQVRELDGYQVVDAKYEKHVLMVVAVNTKTGKYDRFVFRFARDWIGYDVRIVADVPNMGINFTVLDNHKVACITEDEKLEIFLSDKDSPIVKQIDDPVIEGDMVLSSRGNEVLFSKGTNLYSITAK